MKRRRDSYLGGSTIHVPGRSRSDDDGPPLALARARDRAIHEGDASAAAREAATVLFVDFTKELQATLRDMNGSPDRGGSSIHVLEALNWRERLGKVVELARNVGADEAAKVAQGLMGKLAEVERHLRWAKLYPDDYPEADWVYWWGFIYETHLSG